MTSPFRRATAAITLLLLGMLLTFCAYRIWLRMYPNHDDPKNLKYLLWTYGLNESMNLDDAVDAPWRMTITPRDWCWDCHKKN